MKQKVEKLARLSFVKILKLLKSEHLNSSLKIVKLNEINQDTKSFPDREGVLKVLISTLKLKS